MGTAEGGYRVYSIELGDGEFIRLTILGFLSAGRRDPVAIMAAVHRYLDRILGQVPL
jgi:hypothetical protein